MCTRTCDPVKGTWGTPSSLTKQMGTQGVTNSPNIYVWFHDPQICNNFPQPNRSSFYISQSFFIFDRRVIGTPAPPNDNNRLWPLLHYGIFKLMEPQGVLVILESVNEKYNSCGVKCPIKCQNPKKKKSI